MGNVVIKVIASPVLIWGASLVGQRWGQSVAGWLVGMPLTTGPVVFFLAIDHGADFASRAAIGALAGTTAQTGFCLAYARAACRFGWPTALVAATVGYALVGLLWEITEPPFFVLLPIVIFALGAGLCLVPRPVGLGDTTAVVPNWDIPARMLVATALVVGLSAAAPLIGPRLAGLLATFPVFATVLTIFAHRLDGETAARRVLRGLLIGLFGFTGFFSMLALVLPTVGITAAFACAMLTAILIQGCTLWLIRRGIPARHTR